MKILKVKSIQNIQKTDMLVLPKPDGTVHKLIIFKISEDTETGNYTIRFYDDTELKLAWNSQLLVEEDI